MPSGPVRLAHKMNHHRVLSPPEQRFTCGHSISLLHKMQMKASREQSLSSLSKRHHNPHESRTERLLSWLPSASQVWLEPRCFWVSYPQERTHISRSLMASKKNWFCLILVAKSFLIRLLGKKPLCAIGGNANWCHHNGKQYGGSSTN